MARYHWDPDGYLAMIGKEVPEYERLQVETAAATEVDAKRKRLCRRGWGAADPC
jgi:hypothetical protein